ncbi:MULTISPECIES: ATP-dependent zinc protease [unclassified Agrococcus]|uniref:ATP-dependent zinc protease family protein n=1 Tax=unclassified Agrococcus TaxID=2615065 RepID=UPI0036209E4D
MSAPHPASTAVAGWREWVGLPSFGLDHVKAKLDTGARTSALHAFDLEEVTVDGVDRVRFAIHPWQRSTADSVDVDVPVHDRRLIRSSNGTEQERIVILAPIALLGRVVEVEMSLTRRDEMGFRMLVGREALRQGFLVDSARSYLGGRPPREVRSRNRGRDGA